MPIKKLSKKNNFFFYIGLPLYRLLLAAFLVFFITITKTFHVLQSIKLFTIPKPTFPSLTFNPTKIIVIATTSVILSYFTIQFIKSLPNPKSISQFPSKLSTRILDRNGLLLYQIYKDENRTKISINSLPDHVKNAFLAAEDKDFYNHHGFSLSGLARAFYKNLLNQKIEGGSTITQQLVKNTLLNNEKTLIRKIKELVLSLEIEAIYSKDQIFETYLNQVGFGGPAYGIQEAAQQYFATNAASLSISQSAYLAGLTRAPSLYSPYGEHPEEGHQRQKIVLGQMLDNQLISPAEHKAASEEKIVFNPRKIEINAPHFVMYVRDLLIHQLGEKIVTQDGLEIKTTLDLNLQNKVQDIVTSEVKKLKNLRVGNGAALVLKPSTGEVLAMVGSTDYFDLKNNGQVNLTTALRQPGSSIKPLNYALAFEKGKNPNSTIEDKPITFIYPNKEKWSPKNYDGKFHGTITLRQALGNSYNIPSVLLLKESGIENFAKLAQKMGISTWNDPKRHGLSMALGSLEVKMVELAAAYSSFANDGVYTPPSVILDYQSSKNQLPFFSTCTNQNETANEQNVSSALANEDICLARRVISSQTASQITNILQDNQARSTAFGSNSVLNIKNEKIAVKTGTSNDLRDNWTIGFNKDYLVAVWVGNNDNSSMSKIASGITGASPIWSQIFKHLLATKP